MAADFAPDGVQENGGFTVYALLSTAFQGGGPLSDAT